LIAGRPDRSDRIDEILDTRICNQLLQVVSGVEFGEGREGLLPAEAG
jgi:hypothetical protein